MGTDISIYAEKQVDDQWVPVPEPRRTGRKRQNALPVEALDIGRPYELFSVLSGHGVGLRARMAELPAGFGGRGLPDDLNPVYRKSFRTFRNPEIARDHRVSWLEVQEFREFDWDQRVREYAFVEKRYAGMFHESQGFPEGFPEGAPLYHDLFMKTPAGSVKVWWSRSLREYVGHVDWFADSLEKLAPGFPIRVIYWFDS